MDNPEVAPIEPPSPPDKKKKMGKIGLAIASLLTIAAAALGGIRGSSSSPVEPSISPSESLARSMDRSQAGPDGEEVKIKPPHVGEAGLDNSGK